MIFEQNGTIVSLPSEYSAVIAFNQTGLLSQGWSSVSDLTTIEKMFDLDGLGLTAPNFFGVGDSVLGPDPGEILLVDSGEVGTRRAACFNLTYAKNATDPPYNIDLAYVELSLTN